MTERDSVTERWTERVTERLSRKKQRNEETELSYEETMKQRNNVTKKQTK